MEIRSIFFDESGWLRSGWRFAVFCLAFVFMALFLGSGASAGLMLFGNQTELGMQGAMLMTGLVTLVSALLVGWVCGKMLEGLPFRALGAWFTKGWLRNLVAGVLVGSATLGLAILIAYGSGGLRFELTTLDAPTVARSVALSFLIFAVGAAAEEALFRGYILQTFSRSGLAWIGIAITSLFFGAVHWRNPNSGIISTIDTIVAGVWFSIAYLKTRDLWFVWGMHFIWNWMQGSIFGIEVSGLTDFAAGSVLRELDSGPTWLTGGSYGIEGGIASTVALVVSTAVIYFMPYLKPSEEMLSLTGSQNRER